MTPRYDHQFGNVTEGKPLHETRSREFVLGELRRLGLEHISSIADSYKTEDELREGR